MLDLYSDVSLQWRFIEYPIQAFIAYKYKAKHRTKVAPYSRTYLHASCFSEYPLPYRPA